MKIDIDVPDGISGDWRVETFKVEEDELSEMLSMIKTGRGVPEGIYKRLVYKNDTVMSNTPDEIRDFVWPLSNVKGKVLLNGLGLGVTVKFLLEKPEVTEMIVIENSVDVIKLVGPTYSKDPRVKIILDNALTYQPSKGTRYDFVWHDIWNGICSDNLEEMKKLHRKYGRRTEGQASWCRHLCERQRDWGYGY